MRRLAVILLAACTGSGCLQKVQYDEDWQIKQSDETQKFNKHFMRGFNSEEEGGTQYDLDVMASKKFNATSDLKTTEYATNEVESRGFFGAKKKSADGAVEYATRDIESGSYKDDRDFSGSVDYQTSESSLASRNWKPRKDSYHHVTDYGKRTAAKSFATGEYATAQGDASRDVFLGRANEMRSAEDLRASYKDDPSLREPVRTPGVSLDEVRNMLEE